MNRLPRRKRAHIIQLLVEGMSLRAITRVTGCSINTATKLLIAAGEAAEDYHDEHVRGLTSTRRIQADEIWSFTYAKEDHLPAAKKAPEGAGDTWTWTAMDADHKLMVSWMIGSREETTAVDLMMDLAGRLRNRVQITSDGLSAYVPAVKSVFGSDVDFAQLIKQYGKTRDTDENTTSARYSPPKCTGYRIRKIAGLPHRKHINTSYIERQNLTLRMEARRFTRLTNAFSKKLEHHALHVALHYLHYNFCRIHKTLRVTPAMAAGVTDTLRDVDWIAGLVEARDPKPGPRGPYRKRAKARDT